MVKIIEGERAVLEKQAADIIRDSVFKVLRKKGLAVLAIPGGRSVSGIFRLLRKDRFMPWDKIHIFIVDERLVPITHEYSNYKQAYDVFLRYLMEDYILEEENVHPFVIDSFKTDLGISSYEKELKKFGWTYDIVLLSSGEDGHIGALYPDHASIRDDSEYFIVMHDSPKPPKDRMTMSREHLLRSKVALLLFFGEGKRDAYGLFLKDRDAYEKCPARLLHKIKDSYVFSDAIGGKA